LQEVTVLNVSSTDAMRLSISHQVRRDRKAIAPFAERLIAKAAFVRQLTATKLNTTATTAATSDGIRDNIHDPLRHRSVANSRNNSRNNSSSTLLRLSSSGSIDAAGTAVPQLTVVSTRRKVKSAVARMKLASVALAASKAAAVVAAATAVSSATNAAAASTATTSTLAATTTAAVSSVNHVQTVEFRTTSAEAEAGSTNITKGAIKHM
jgi:hypothetical protein